MKKPETDALRLAPSMPTVEMTDDMLFKIETGETVTWGELKRRQYEQAVRNFNTMREDGSLAAPASPLPEGGWLERNEQWAEMQACQFDKTADALEQSAEGWRSKTSHPENAHMVTVCLLKAATWREAAWSLRQPKSVRHEREARGQ